MTPLRHLPFLAISLVAALAAGAGGYRLRAALAPKEVAPEQLAAGCAAARIACGVDHALALTDRGSKDAAAFQSWIAAREAAYRDRNERAARAAQIRAACDAAQKEAQVLLDWLESAKPADALAGLYSLPPPSPEALRSAIAKLANSEASMKAAIQSLDDSVTSPASRPADREKSLAAATKALAEADAVEASTVVPPAANDPQEAIKQLDLLQNKFAAHLQDLGKLFPAPP